MEIGGSSSCLSRQWLAFLDESLFEEFTKPQPIILMSSPEQNRRELTVTTEKASRKRPRDDTPGTPSKAVREKMRRDKLNDKFLELSFALEPAIGRPLKTDKSAILSEAACIVQQLRVEAQQLKESNVKLREAVKDLKAEKNDLRDEKVRLKAEKERLEEQLKTFSIPLMPHIPFQAYKLEHVSATSAPEFSNAMWQWMPSKSTDTSQDHLLRPPAA